MGTMYQVCTELYIHIYSTHIYLTHTTAHKVDTLYIIIIPILQIRNLKSNEVNLPNSSN